MTALRLSEPTAPFGSARSVSVQAVPAQSSLRSIAGSAIRGLLFLSLLVLSACSTNPVTGRSEFLVMSPEREAALGRQAAAQVEAEMGLVQDPELVRYVEELGQRLALNSPRRDVKYTFAVADMPEPNAFALPGGYIYVSRGLLTIANSEAELANVIGHEIGHVAARHSAQRETRSLGVGLLSMLGTIVAGATGGAKAAEQVAQLGQVAGQGFIAAYGRDQERQADEVGQGLASEAGWDPAGMPQFLATLDRDSELRFGGTRNPSFLDSHPVTQERVRDTAARAAMLSAESGAGASRSRREFLSPLDGLLVGPNPEEGVFRGERFLHPTLGFALDYPVGWRTQNQKAAVVAQSPQGDVAVLEMQGPTGDPAAAAQSFAQTHQIQLQSGQAGRIGGFPAYRALAQSQSQQGAVGLDLTWIAHDAGMIRLTGMAPAARFESAARTFRDFAVSFRPLNRAEVNAIHALRLRLAVARSGESLASLSQRTGNRWTLEQTAVANGMSPDARLSRGDVVKVAVDAPLGR